MKTDDLIAALTADAPAVSQPITRTVVACVGAGALAAALLFYLMLGMRPDVMSAMGTPRFAFKIVSMLVLFASAFALMLHVVRPQAVSPGWIAALAIAPALIIIATIAELFAVPSGEWMGRLMGRAYVACLVLIPTLSALPLVATLFAMRQGAPSHPALAGAVAGLVAGGIGASLYGTHCVEDSPLFVATWYVIGIAFITAVGAIAGSRILRW
jgi:hypothetical protein